MGSVITATGQSFRCDYFVMMEAQGILYVRVLGVDEETVNEVFSNTNETSCLRNGNRTAFGYINLKMILREGDAFKVVLSR